MRSILSIPGLMALTALWAPAGAADGSLAGFTAGLGAGGHIASYSSWSGLSTPWKSYATLGDAKGLAWEVEGGYGWKRFLLQARFSRRYQSVRYETEVYPVNMPPRREVRERDVTVHYPAIGGAFHFTHGLLGASRHFQINADGGLLMVNEDGFYKNAFLGWSGGLAQEVFPHVFLEAKTVSGSVDSDFRDIDVFSIQILLKAVYY